MEQTHLISVCVFCLLCATHIHCSEYSSRASKSKVKSSGSNLEKFEAGAPENAAARGRPRSNASSLGSPFRYGNEFDFAGSREQQFLNSIQKSADSAAVLRRRDARAASTDGTVEFESDRSVADAASNGIGSSLNGVQTINKYIKIPESPNGAATAEDTIDGGGLRRQSRPRRDVNDRKRRSAEYRVPVLDERLYIENLFKKYRNDENRIDLNGLKTMLSHLGLNPFATLGLAERDARVDSLELRDGGGRAENGADSNRTANHECLTPEELLGAVVREAVAHNGVNISSDLFHGEKRAESVLPDETQQSDAAEDISVASNAVNLYLSKNGLLKLCPFLMYQLVEPRVCQSEHQHEEHDENHNLLAWLYATASVVIVSLCGLLGVFVIPIMGHAFYQQLLQFLVALAVGTLCGDALLHLLPHAMIPHNDDAHDVGEAHDHDHTSTMWKGLAVLLGIVFFFFTEKCLTLASEWRKKHQRNSQVQGHSHVQILNGNNESDSIGEKLCKHKYSSYPYCYPDIKSNKDGHEHSRKHVNDSRCNNVEERDAKTCLVSKWNNDAKDVGENQRLTHVSDPEQREEEKLSAIDDNDHITGRDAKVDENEVSCGRKDGEYTVIIREHETSHHGHSHAHGHVHSPPESLSSVAWMVILGDGLHNFTDGMAIGAAFANNIAGGFSTAVAVFCHELPHELGDFAVLIKAGMSAKQAVFYNLISSILCFFGMCLGIFVGDNPQSTSWVFAVSAGMFLYIGLVDMFPELTSSHSAVESSFCQCSLQGLGLISGVSIMLIIAFYEDQLLTLFK